MTTITTTTTIISFYLIGVSFQSYSRLGQLPKKRFGDCCSRFSKAKSLSCCPTSSSKTEGMQEKIQKYWMLVYDSWCESYLCWFPMFDWCRSSAVQLVRVRRGTPSRWSYTEDSLRETSCHAAVHTLQLRAHSLHAWMQDDSDSRLKSLAHQVHANIHTIQQLSSIHYQH